MLQGGLLLWTFGGGLNRIKPVGYNRTGLFMPTLIRTHYLPVVNQHVQPTVLIRIKKAPFIDNPLLGLLNKTVFQFLYIDR